MLRLLTFWFLAARGREVRSFICLSKRITLICFAQKGVARIQVNTVMAGNHVTIRQFHHTF